MSQTTGSIYLPAISQAPWKKVESKKGEAIIPRSRSCNMMVWFAGIDVLASPRVSRLNVHHEKNHAA
jgi:hypothetical protein